MACGQGAPAPDTGEMTFSGLALGVGNRDTWVRVPYTYIEVYFLPFRDLRSSESEGEKGGHECRQAGTPPTELAWPPAGRPSLMPWHLAEGTLPDLRSYQIHNPTCPQGGLTPSRRSHLFVSLCFANLWTPPGHPWVSRKGTLGVFLKQINKTPRVSDGRHGLCGWEWPS